MNKNEQLLNEFLATKSNSSKPQYNSSIKRLFTFVNNQDIETVTSKQLNDFLESCQASKNYINAFMTYVYSKPENAIRQNWDIIKWCLHKDYKELIKC